MRLLLGAAGFAAALALGCQDTGMVSVSGTVTLDGKPVDGGGITFSPLDGKGPTAGAVLANGAYATTVPRGKLRVEVRASKVVGKRKEFDTPDGRTVDVLAEAVPERYNSGSTLTAEVTGKNAALNFELTSDKK